MDESTWTEDPESSASLMIYVEVDIIAADYFNMFRNYTWRIQQRPVQKQSEQIEN